MCRRIRGRWWKYGCMLNYLFWLVLCGFFRLWMCFYFCLFFFMLLLFLMVFKVFFFFWVMFVIYVCGICVVVRRLMCLIFLMYFFNLVCCYFFKNLWNFSYFYCLKLMLLNVLEILLFRFMFVFEVGVVY